MVNLLQKYLLVGLGCLVVSGRAIHTEPFHKGGFPLFRQVVTLTELLHSQVPKSVPVVNPSIAVKGEDVLLTSLPVR
jgi:hypothetical protein